MIRKLYKEDLIIDIVIKMELENITEVLALDVSSVDAINKRLDVGWHLLVIFEDGDTKVLLGKE